MITYSLTRSRRKTLAVYVKPDGSVEVRAPLKLSLTSIEQFVSSKEKWIKQKQAQFALSRAAPPQELPVLYAPGEFEQVSRALVKAWEERLGVSSSYVGFRAMTSRWGSCTAKTRRIRLSTTLNRHPRECLEYVIVHELAHLLECNHSPRFWAIIESALPDYKERRKKLRALQQ